MSLLPTSWHSFPFLHPSWGCSPSPPPPGVHPCQNTSGAHCNMPSRSTYFLTLPHPPPCTPLSAPSPLHPTLSPSPFAPCRLRLLGLTSCGSACSSCSHTYTSLDTATLPGMQSWQVRGSNPHDDGTRYPNTTFSTAQLLATTRKISSLCLYFSWLCPRTTPIVHASPGFCDFFALSDAIPRLSDFYTC